VETRTSGSEGGLRKRTSRKTGTAPQPDPYVWRDQAEHAAESLSKGSRVVIVGRLQQQAWTAQDGSARSVVEVGLRSWGRASLVNGNHDQDDEEPEPPGSATGRPEAQPAGVPLRTAGCSRHAWRMPRLTLPTTAVEDSYLAGETEAAIEEGLSADWLQEAAADFAGFVERRRVVREMWGVPVTELWFVDGISYLGTVMIRHRLSPALERAGGHIGYHVVPSHRRGGHATQMLAQALAVCQQLGLSQILVTCAVDNLGSRRVIEANGGALDRVVDGEAHYWLPTSQQRT
jgi:predicted acetyltransferase